MLELGVRHAVPLIQQHQFEYRQRRVRPTAAAVGVHTLAQTLGLVRDLDPVLERVQLQRRRFLHRQPSAQQEEAVPALVSPRPLAPRIREFVQRLQATASPEGEALTVSGNRCTIIESARRGR